MRYVEDHDMVNFMWNIVVKCFEHRAADPKHFVLELLQNMEPKNVKGQTNDPKKNINSSPEAATQAVDPEGEKRNDPKQKRAKKQEQLSEDEEAIQHRQTIDGTLNFFSQNSSDLMGNVFTMLESGASMMTMTRSRKDSIPQSSSSFFNRGTLSEVSMQSQSEIASRLLANRGKI